jgi:hypothetical protein
MALYSTKRIWKYLVLLVDNGQQFTKMPYNPLNSFGPGIVRYTYASVYVG